MAKSKALIAAEQKIAALEARLEVARTLYREHKVRIAELESALAARGRGVTRIKTQPQTVEFVKNDGSRWIKTPIGNGTYAVRPA